MDLQTAFHWIYVISMMIGAFYFMSLGNNPRGVPKSEYLVATFIPIWSGLAYMAMALGQGKVEIAGQITHYARYIDWIVTTPLLLLSLSWTAMYFIAKDWTLIAALMATQTIVVVTGLIADLSGNGEARFLWYTCGVVAFLVILWGIWIPLRAKTRGQGVELSRLYNRLSTYFTVLWVSYPIVWLIGPSGLNWVNQTIETLLFCVLPFFSKVGFSYLDLNGLRRLSRAKANAATASHSVTH
ncbi:bacteriorhodopsin [Leptolyngbya sp. FACHB-261]|uniref:bacteriorhodopsin n=1 Tax=Leptolyngbya sp. FACHB-261 TaxID=2692806 RepID=UPI00168319FB|nr:bacteriorhodopsin [Leptolyngbya sp. FACHB-261]MBD2103963.1 bacteriorhodopsin [Leptolyngbya sp. FACHB-261]